MSEARQVTCDGCGQDLTYTGNSIDYRVVLGNESLPSCGGFVTDMMIYPPIEGGSKHFCGVGCLASWMKKTYPSQFSA